MRSWLRCTHHSTPILPWEKPQPLLEELSKTCQTSTLSNCQVMENKDSEILPQITGHRVTKCNLESVLVVSGLCSPKTGVFSLFSQARRRDGSCPPKRPAAWWTLLKLNKTRPVGVSGLDHRWLVKLGVLPQELAECRDRQSGWLRFLWFSLDTGSLLCKASAHPWSGMMVASCRRVRSPWGWARDRVGTVLTCPFRAQAGRFSMPSSVPKSDCSFRSFSHFSSQVGDGGEPGFPPTVGLNSVCNT